MRLDTVGILTSTYVKEGAEVGYVRFTDVVNGAYLEFRAPASEANRLKPHVGTAIQLQAEITVNRFGDNNSFEILSLVGIKPVKVVIQEIAPASKAG